jgi:hypothetical protein
LEPSLKVRAKLAEVAAGVKLGLNVVGLGLGRCQPAGSGWRRLLAVEIRISLRLSLSCCTYSCLCCS